jgi:hypothetical protein
LDTWSLQQWPADADNDPITYAIVSGDALNQFAITASGQIRIASALDYETKSSYTLQIAAIAAGDTVTQDLIVSVINVNDNAPSIQNYTFTISELDTIGTLLGVITATDADGDAVTISIEIQ